MQQTVKIRNAVRSDAEVISKITKAAFEDYAKHLPSPPEALTETVSDIESDIKEKCVLIAECDGQILGTLRLSIKDGGAYLSRFAVNPDAQSLGIGKQLLNQADIQAREMKADSIRLHTASESQSLMNFYTANGYRILEINTDRGYSRATLIKNI